MKADGKKIVVNNGHRMTVPMIGGGIYLKEDHNFPEANESNGRFIPGDVFHLEPFASIDESRPALQNIALTDYGAYAVDGFILGYTALGNEAIPEAPDGEVDPLLIPTAAVRLLQRMVKHNNGYGLWMQRDGARLYFTARGSVRGVDVAITVSLSTSVERFPEAWTVLQDTENKVNARAAGVADISPGILKTRLKDAINPMQAPVANLLFWDTLKVLVYDMHNPTLSVFWDTLNSVQGRGVITVDARLLLKGLEFLATDADRLFQAAQEKGLPFVEQVAMLSAKEPFLLSQAYRRVVIMPMNDPDADKANKTGSLAPFQQYLPEELIQQYQLHEQANVEEELAPLPV